MWARSVRLDPPTYKEPTLFPVNQSQTEPLPPGKPPPPPPPGGGGGHCLFEGRYPKQNYRPPVLCSHSPLTLSLLFYSSLFLRHQRKAYCYYCCYCGLPPVDIIFSCPDTITLITVAKTLIIANPGCFPWLTTTAPTGNAPLTAPLLRVLGSLTAPPFSSPQPQLRESVLQWVPKTRVSAPPPPGPSPLPEGTGRGCYR